MVTDILKSTRSSRIYEKSTCITEKQNTRAKSRYGYAEKMRLRRKLGGQKCCRLSNFASIQENKVGIADKLRNYVGTLGIIEKPRYYLERKQTNTSNHRMVKLRRNAGLYENASSYVISSDKTRVSHGLCKKKKKKCSRLNNLGSI